MSKRVLLGLSGGVDSSVAAYLLKKEGYDVHAIFMVNWKEHGVCNWEEDMGIARAVAKKLSLPLQIWDFAAEYQKYVFEDFIAEYKKGLTPNPDVFCNKYIKFGSFYKRAMEEGADYVATGHYARVQESRIKNKEFGLYSAIDKTKDQSYFLYQIKPTQLSRALFPVGELLKTRVKEIARSLGLVSWNKPESMGICFIGEIPIKSFLQKYILPKEGVIYDTKGKPLGTHEGVWYYTLGQREGLKIGGTGPFFVVKKDIRKNILIVAREPEASKLLMVKRVTLMKVNLFNSITLSQRHPEFDPGSRKKNKKQKDLNSFGFLDSRSKPGMTNGIEVLWRDRHLSPLNNGMLRKKYGKWIVEFENPKRSVTPGQSLVMYDQRGERVVGGGVIVKINSK